jgi:hypothetical protein
LSCFVHENLLTVYVSELFNKTFTFVEKYVIVGKTCKTSLLGGVFFATGKEKVSIYPRFLFENSVSVVHGVTGPGSSLSLIRREGETSVE